MWRMLILKTLVGTNIHGNMIAYITNFLLNRKFRVRVNGHTSDEYHQENGVPQGEVLSVILFLMGFNNISKYIDKEIEFLLFADDLVIFTTSANISKTIPTIQRNINNICKFGNENGLTFSEEKTKFMVFSRKHQTPQIRLSMYSKQIEEVDFHKFLGITFDKKLNWKQHIMHLKVIATKKSNIIKMLLL